MTVSLTPKIYYLDLEVDSFPRHQGEPWQCITEVGIVDPSRAEGRQGFYAHVKPPKELRRKAITRCFDPDYKETPKISFKNLWPEMKNWINQGLDGNRMAVIVMHNGYEHDWPVLKRECARINEGVPGFWKPFDSCLLARIRKVALDCSLSGLCHTYKVPLLPAHNAYNDAVMLRGVFEKIIGSTPIEEVLKQIPGESHPVKQVAAAIKTCEAADLIFFDFETTGLIPKKGENMPFPRVVELAGYIPGKNKSFQSLVNPKCSIPPDMVHGITDKDVESAPDFKEAWTSFERWMEAELGTTAKVVLAGHNIWGFDLKILQAECERVGLRCRKWKSFDTLAFSRHLCAGNQPPSHRLQSLRETMGIAENDAHRALGDVQVNYEVFKRFVEGVDEKKMPAALQSGRPVLAMGQLVRDYGVFKPSSLKKAAPKPRTDMEEGTSSKKSKRPAEAAGISSSSSRKLVLYDESDEE